MSPVPWAMTGVETEACCPRFSGLSRMTVGLPSLTRPAAVRGAKPPRQCVDRCLTRRPSAQLGQQIRTERLALGPIGLVLALVAVRLRRCSVLSILMRSHH